MSLKEKISYYSVSMGQRRNVVYLVVGGILTACTLIYALSGGSEVSHRAKTNAEIVNPLDMLDQGDLWIHKSEHRLDGQDKEIANLKNEIHKLEKSSKNEHFDTNKEFDNRIKRLEELLDNKFAQEQTTQQLNTYNASSPNIVSGNTFGGFPNGNPVVAEEVYEVEEAAILSLSIGLTTRKSEPTVGMHVDNFIPVGSFAKAALLTGVDAPAAVTSAENPVPMVLKIIDDAILPRQMRGKIESCHVTASAYGELSEERVRVRLDKISCTYLDGRIFVENIDGYVAGEDGKNGIRGKVIWRDGALVARSFASGLLGGIAQGIGDAAGKTSTSPLGTVQSYPGSELFQQGIGAGAGSALNKLSEYEIKKAEAYHPVIEVQAGRIVDIVINSRKDSKNNGLYLGEEPLS